MILSDVDILDAIKAGEITIENSSGKFEPASYDMHVGNQAVTKRALVDLQKAKYVTIPRGETAVIYPTEKIKLGITVAAHFGLTSRLARRGLILLSGPQIDPGYHGWLEITVFNTGNHAVRVMHGEAFATIEFSRLLTPASRGYSGQYQSLPQVTPEVLETIQSRHHRSFAEFEDDVRVLKAQVSNLRWIILTIFGSIIAGITVELVSRLFTH